MKRIVFMAALVVSLSACDNTKKLQLRAPQPKGTEATASAETKKSDSLLTDSIKKDTVAVH